jgi:25S rRNA (uracil2634-N3)-methyltransferase
MLDAPTKGLWPYIASQHGNRTEMPLAKPSPHEIDHLIGSSAYRDSRHPQSAATRNSVMNWFATRYGSGNRIDEQPFASDDVHNFQNVRQNHIVYRALNCKTLLLGEGNFSFTSSIVFDHHAPPMMITSTIYESIRDISDDSRDDAQKLFKMGVNILENVDATRLDLTFPYQKFDTIIFQFPNAGSREPNRGHNPNFILVRRFLKSALERIRQDGEIIISVVNSPYYEGRFRMDEAAEYAGITNFFAIPFSPGDFPSYSHVNTNDEDSALKEHRSFETWIFQP